MRGRYGRCVADYLARRVSEAAASPSSYDAAASAMHQRPTRRQVVSSAIGFATRLAFEQALEQRSDGRLHLDPNEHGRTAITSAYPFGQCPYADGPVTTAVVRPIVMRCRACALGGFGSSRHQLRRRIGVCSVRPITTATSPARTSGASGAPVDGRLLSTTNTPTIGPAIGSPPSLTQ
jgi:hypothetical protein